ncbi:MAG: hypothetical protein BGO60_03340 [Thiobacillus sp. 65-1059]|nr:MAG: hypothetical protein BGO60_03340 [Thiobacillus sp. 65-1059]
MDSLPPILYKYFGPERIDVLAKCMMRYSPLGAFNDPFEGRPEVTSLVSADFARESLAEALQQEAKSAYAQFPQEAQAALTYETWEQLLAKELKSKEVEILQTIDERTPEFRNLMFQKLDELLGALCLSEVPDSLLMWSHYAASHTGFVLEFDARHSHFNEGKGPEDEFRHLRRVLYREARPSGMLIDFDGVDFFLVKSSHWSYEREWRIFRPLSDADVVIPGQPYGVHLFPFPANALRAVIFGARASEETKEAIRMSIRTNQSLRHVRLRNARPDDFHFLLRIVDAPA